MTKFDRSEEIESTDVRNSTRKQIKKKNRTEKDTMLKIQ